MKKYSVLMSLYWKEKPDYFCEAIESMINQTVTPDEIVIVKDGPLTQELEMVLSHYQNKYADLLQIVTSETNLGLGMALNLGMQQCKNELIARMDTDDISKPVRCEKQLKMFEGNPNLAIVGSNIDEFVDSMDHVISVRKVPISHSDIYRFAKRRSAFNHPTVMYRKSRVLEVGGYREQRRAQDLDLFGRMLFSGCIARNIDESLLYFRSNKFAKERRGNWESTKNYVGTIYHFWKLGYSSFFDYIIVLFVKTMMFFLPTKIQNWIYQEFLRKHIKNEFSI